MAQLLNAESSSRWHPEMHGISADESEDRKLTKMDTNIEWNWEGKTIRLGMTRVGTGPLILLLPALSSISTRREMRPLQDRLANSFVTVAVDWPGFGDLPRPPVDWRPETYRAFLRHLLRDVCPSPHATIAAGHAAGYLLAQAAAQADRTGRCILIAPTWRGPLPTMLGRRSRAFTALAHAVDVPGLGPLLYRINVNRPVVGMMARRHVYDDPAWLSGARLADKLAVIGAAGARHASFRFVTGELDPMLDQTEFLAAVALLKEPALVLYGANTPPKSKAEIESLAALSNATLICLPKGKLSIHEEYPDRVADVVRGFLATR